MSDPVLDVAATPEIKPREFEQIRKFAFETFGLDLRHGKERLVSARLGKQIRAGGFRSFDAYFQHVQLDKTGEALVALIDALTTNHTSFLREQEHFRFLVETILPSIVNRSKFTVWSAASATGEEPYSILCTLLDGSRGRRAPDFRVVATDISTKVLEVAKRGVYPAERTRALPPGWLPQYFLRGEGTSKGFYQIKPEFRAKVEFRRLNLMQPLPWRELFPLVFCRNVMIYFNKTTQADLVNRMAACIEPGGYLFVGHAESLTGIDHPLQYVRPAIYRKPA